MLLLILATKNADKFSFFWNGLIYWFSAKKIEKYRNSTMKPFLREHLFGIFDYCTDAGKNTRGFSEQSIIIPTIPIMFTLCSINYPDHSPNARIKSFTRDTFFLRYG